MRTNLELLDTLVPLRGASYVDAVSAGIDVPLRYAEFFVQLADGAAARLACRWQLLGFDRARGRFCFRVGNSVLLVDDLPGARLNLERWTPTGFCSAHTRRNPDVARLGDCLKLTATDGSLIFVARAETVSLGSTRRVQPVYQPPRRLSLQAGTSSPQWLGR